MPLHIPFYIILYRKWLCIFKTLLSVCGHQLVSWDQTYLAVSGSQYQVWVWASFSLAGMWVAGVLSRNEVGVEVGSEAWVEAGSGTGIGRTGDGAEDAVGTGTGSGT